PAGPKAARTRRPALASTARTPRPWTGPASSSCAADRDELREGPHGGEPAAILAGVRAALDAVALLDGHRQVERIDGIEAESLGEERRGGVDVGGRDVLQHQGLDDEALELQFQILMRGHVRASARRVRASPPSIDAQQSPR